MIQQLHRFVSNRNAAAVLLGLHAWLEWKAGVKAGGGLPWVAASVFAATSAGLLLHWRWARWAGIALLVVLAGLKLHALATMGMAWRPAVHAFGFGFVAYQLWRHPELDSSRRKPSHHQHPTRHRSHSCLLRGQPRNLDAPTLALALSAAWGLRITSGDEPPEDSDGFVGGDPQHFLVAVTQMMPAIFMVHNLGTGYFDETEEIAGAVPNLRLAQIIRGHRAWMSVDYLGEGIGRERPGRSLPHDRQGRSSAGR